MSGSPLCSDTVRFLISFPSFTSSFLNHALISAFSIAFSILCCYRFRFMASYTPWLQFHNLNHQKTVCVCSQIWPNVGLHYINFEDTLRILHSARATRPFPSKFGFRVSSAYTWVMCQNHTPTPTRSVDRYCARAPIASPVRHSAICKSVAAIMIPSLQRLWRPKSVRQQCLVHGGWNGEIRQITRDGSCSEGSRHLTSLCAACTKQCRIQKWVFMNNTDVHHVRESRSQSEDVCSV